MVYNKTPSANPETTRQHAGHIAHRKLLAEQKAMQMERRAARLRNKRQAKGV